MAEKKPRMDMSVNSINTSPCWQQYHIGYICVGRAGDIWTIVLLLFFFQFLAHLYNQINSVCHRLRQSIAAMFGIWTVNAELCPNICIHCSWMNINLLHCSSVSIIILHKMVYNSQLDRLANSFKSCRAGSLGHLLADSLTHRVSVNVLP